MADRSELFGIGTCSKPGCLSPWAKICKNCNLSFCGSCVQSHKHWNTGEPCAPESREVREKLYLTDLTETQDPVEDVQPCPPPL